MARYKESSCRICRRENLKMYLKGDRCYTDKCAIERRPYPPGQHGQGRAKFSEYGVQLREKQKVKRLYGLLESQFRGNERKVNIPSFQVRVGDIVAVKGKSKKIVRINEALEAVDRRGVPAWLDLDKPAFRGTVKASPAREDITMPIQEQLIVELYSK